MKKTVLIGAALLLSAFLFAHEFWIEPEKFIYKWNESINLRFFVGENFEGANWTGNDSSVNTLRLYYSGVNDDLDGSISAAIGDSLQLKVLDEGTCVVALNTTNKFIQLDAEKFEEYLKEDGMEYIIEERKLRGFSAKPGREHYQRSVKTILQIGDEYTRAAQTRTRLPLDLVLTANPYQLRDSDSLGVQMFFRGKEMSNQLINIWHRIADSTTRLSIRSDSSGIVKFPVNRSGKWMVSAVYMEHSPIDSVDWQSYWGSCTWGYY